MNVEFEAEGLLEGVQDARPRGATRASETGLDVPFLLDEPGRPPDRTGDVEVFRVRSGSA